MPEEKGFSEEMRWATASLWSEIHSHPFVKGIGEGDLSKERIAYYLRQDYLYLVDFARVLALAAAKAPDLPTMTRFSGLLETTLAMEMDLHRRTCAAFGIGAEELERTQPSLVTSAYTAMLLRTCYEGPMSDIAAALLPCAAGYVEIACALRDAGLPEAGFCRDWIETYTSEEMQEAARWLAGLVDAGAEHAPAADRSRWLLLYRTSAWFEYLFFESAWAKEPWPHAVPA
jgi:thiaminase/transcriptional activator TenA